MPVSAIILAAGEGTRMRSNRPKPLHMICGRPMVMHVIHAIAELDVERTIVVVGHGAEQVTKKIQEQAPSSANVTFVEQVEPRGTGHAVIVGLTVLPDEDLDDTSTILVLPGDAPLLRRETLDDLVAQHVARGDAVTLLSARLDDPTGYGRVVRAPSKAGDGRVQAIVEERDATAEQRAIDEVNTSIYCFRRDLLGPALRRISPDNSQAEYYLTDVIGVLAAMGHQIGCVVATDPAETRGVNDRAQLALCETELRARTNRRWLLNGVTMVDPAQTYIEVTVELGRDVSLFPGTVLQGRTTVGDGSEIGPNTRLVDSVIGAGATVESTVARDAEIGDEAQVGPFAFLPPGTSVPRARRTGPFYTGSPD
jgi:bifunctional UDP-N-acetylglucosamine pyrophosphorylase/glucosamine-1-phosphate N-acetyltransferase